jgi:nucleoside recognition membrane protein YjiH
MISLIIVNIIELFINRLIVNDLWDEMICDWRFKFQSYVFSQSIIFEVKNWSMYVNYIRIDVTSISVIRIEIVSKKRFRIDVDVVIFNVFSIRIMCVKWVDN